METIERSIYQNHLTSILDRGTIIVIVGQRRVGKSFMLRQLQSWLIANAEEANVLYIDKERHEFNDIATADDLYKYAVANLPEGGRNYLLIDEVQDIRCFEDALRSLQAEERCQIVVTGSNAYMFSSELATRLSGRYVEVPVHSLTYMEFLEFHRLEDSDDSLNAYLRVGGLPGLAQFDINDEMQVRDYLQGVYNTIMVRDVIAREEIRNVSFIGNLAAFVADNVGKLLSVRNIANAMKSNGGGVSEVSTSTYLNHLCNALIITPTARYDIHGKRLFEQTYKYYFADHGLRNYLCGFNIRGGIEKIMENVVRHHLVAQGFSVTVGILQNGEIDFVATKGGLTAYFQSAYLLGSEETIAREFGNLAKIRDSYPKYVISMDPVAGELPEYPGIRHLRLRDFLKMRF